MVINSKHCNGNSIQFYSADICTVWQLVRSSCDATNNLWGNYGKHLETISIWIKITRLYIRVSHQITTDYIWREGKRHVMQDICSFTNSRQVTLLFTNKLLFQFKFNILPFHSSVEATVSSSSMSNLLQELTKWLAIIVIQYNVTKLHSLCRRWYGPVAGKLWKINPHTK